MFSLNEIEEPVCEGGVPENEASPASKPNIVSQLRVIFQLGLAHGIEIPECNT
jgi:hypothetical protein